MNRPPPSEPSETENLSRSICWIELVEATDALGAPYEGLSREDGSIHNLYRAFSQFPAPLASADRFYRDVMHTSDAPLPMWLAELLSVDVAILNSCAYALAHHGANFIALYDDAAKAEEIINSLQQTGPEIPALEEKVQAILLFGRKLTRHPEDMTQGDIETLRAHGYSDAEISQAVQVTASFAYWTRFINALGISSDGEKIGKYG